MKKILFCLLATQILWANKKTDLSIKSIDFNSCSTAYYLEDCDACGCSASGGSMGYNSMLNDKFIGIRYMQQYYKSKDGVFNDSPWIDENFTTMQFWGRIPILDKLEVMILAPYHFIDREKITSNQKLDGIGDITLMAFYSLYQKDIDSTKFQHKILIGAGIKLPTGKFDSKNNGSVNPSFQLGTGSWDYNVATEYNIGKGKLGLNTTLGYVFKSQNDQKYKFGDQFNYGSTLFYNTKWNNWAIVPQLGIAGEVFQSNEDYREKVPFTKGDILFSKAGVEVGYKKWAAGVTAMLPIHQNLTGGRVEAKYRLALNLNYVL